MDYNVTNYCNVKIYFLFCASVRSVLIVPGLTINILILASVVRCLISKKKGIKNNVVSYIVGSTVFNIINLISWPLMIDWRIYQRWRFSAPVCELMVNVKQIASTISFYYVFCITFSIYMAIVLGYKIVDHRLFTVFQLFFPCVVLLLEELVEHISGWKESHYDAVYKTCFTIINDPTMKIRMLFKILLGLPLTMYFYLHVLVTIFRSAKVMHRSQAPNKKLAKMFSAIGLITFLAHTPGGILPLIADKNICLETATEFLFDLPLFTNPIILFCMNKELRVQCKRILGCKFLSFTRSKSQNSNSAATSDKQKMSDNSTASKLVTISSNE